MRQRTSYIISFCLLLATIGTGSALIAQDASDPARALRERLKRIVIPKIAFKDAPASTIVEFLRNRSRELDPEGQGVNFVLLLRPTKVAADAPGVNKQPATTPTPGHSATAPPPLQPDDAGEVVPFQLLLGPTITINADKLPLDVAIRNICEIGKLRYDIEPNAVVIGYPDVPRTEVELRALPKAPTPPQQTLVAAGTPDPTQALRDRLKRIVFGRVSFEDTPVTTVFEFLRDHSHILDPESKGVNVVLRVWPPGGPPEAPARGKPAAAIPPPGKDAADPIADEPEEGTFAKPAPAPRPRQPTVTLDLDYISVADAIRYTCEVSGLLCHFEPADRRKLEQLIISKLSFEDTPITTVFEFLRRRCRELDPQGTDARFDVLVRPPELGATAPDKNRPATAKPAPADGDTAPDMIEPDDLDRAFVLREFLPQPTVTLELSTVSVGDLIRYACMVSGMRYQIEPNAVVILGPGVTRDTVELQAIPEAPPPPPAK